jgi:predicted CoA-binding protein
MILSDPQIRHILETAVTVAIVGLSDEPDRDSYRVAEYLQDHGYHIVPVNPTVESVLGQKSYARVTDIPGQIEIVDVFRKPDAVPPVVAEAIEARARVVWLQPGVVNQEAAETAEAAGLQVVMDRCIKMEHQRLFGQEH